MSAEKSQHGRHVSPDLLIDVYYGVCDDPAAVRAHLAECASCTERWNDLARKRSASAQPVEVSSDFLAAQRRRIYERLERPAPKLRRLWVPTAATAAVLTAAIFAFRPVQEPWRPEINAVVRPDNSVNSRPDDSSNDAQLFSDVYSLELSYEPSAAAPIQALFEDQN